MNPPRRITRSIEHAKRTRKKVTGRVQDMGGQAGV